MPRYDYAVGFTTDAGTISYGGDIHSTAEGAQSDLEAYAEQTDRALFIVRRVHTPWEQLEAPAAAAGPLWWEGPFKDEGCIAYRGAEEVATGLTESQAIAMVEADREERSLEEHFSIEAFGTALDADPQGLTNYTGCRIVADLYAGEEQGVELLRTPLGSWFSVKAIHGRHHHSSADVRLLRILSIVPLEVEAAAMAYMGGEREWARASEGFRATVLKKMQEALEAAKAVRP